jgi:hypothetical protein
MVLKLGVSPTMTREVFDMGEESVEEYLWTSV